MNGMKLYAQIKDMLRDARRKLDEAENDDQGAISLDERMESIRKMNEAIQQTTHALDMLAERVKQLEANL